MFVDHVDLNGLPKNTNRKNSPENCPDWPVFEFIFDRLVRNYFSTSCHVINFALIFPLGEFSKRKPFQLFHSERFYRKWDQRKIEINPM